MSKSWCSSQTFVIDDGPARPAQDLSGDSKWQPRSAEET